MAGEDKEWKPSQHAHIETPFFLTLLPSLCQTPQESVFIEYKVESTADNEIYVEMKTEDISLASKSSTNASAIVMRMTGKSSEANMTFVITCDVKQEKISQSPPTWIQKKKVHISLNERS